MNPNETNPTTPTGASGAAGGASGTTSSPIPAPLDLTGTSSSGLSMADSLASAQDNLTSAGQAANFTSNTLGMDQLGANNPSASMEMPNQPLTPAAPVPGSIGSVTSVPPLKTAESNFGTTTPPTTSAMPVMGGGNSASSTPNASAAPTTTSSYYNPFAAPTASTPAASTPSATGMSTPAMSSTSSTMPTSSTAVPPALQPQTEKFSDRLKTPKAAKGTTSPKNILMIIGWALALVATILAVFFFMQWQDAEKRASEKQIVYVPSPEPGTDEGDDTVATITCKKDLGGEGTEGLENAINHSQTAIITYFNEPENHNLNFAMLTDDFSFTDNGAAEAARGHFDERAAGLIGIAEGMGIAPLDSNIEVADNVLHYTISGPADRLIGEHANMLLVPVGEDGVAQTSPDSMKASYEANGFACTTE